MYACLFPPQRSWTALMKASQIGDVSIVKMLIGAGASLKVKAEVITSYTIQYKSNWELGVGWVWGGGGGGGGGYQDHPQWRMQNKN